LSEKFRKIIARTRLREATQKEFKLLEVIIRERVLDRKKEVELE